MDAFSAEELSRLRSQPQHFKPKLTAFRPAHIWTGTLNGVHAKGARQLSVTTSTGEIADILPDTTLVHGHGVNESRLRIKESSGTLVTVNENSEDWVNGDDLTALLLFEPHPVFHREVRSDAGVAQYEDYDVPYSDQNENFDPVVNIGPAFFALEIDCENSGSFTDLELDASDSFVFDSTISNYLWGILYGDADPFDAEIIGSSSGTNCTFRFWDTGDFYVWCRITTAAGKSYTGYRPVSVRCDKPGNADSPFYDFSIGSLEGSRETGFWSADVSIFEDCDETQLPRNVPICIHGSAAYGHGATRSTEQVPWHYSSTAHQRFCGMVREETWIDEFKEKGAVVTFKAIGLCGVLDELRNYPCWLQNNAAPTDWTQMAGLSVDRTVFFYLKHRTTLLSITDWHRTGDDRLMRYANLPASKMYPALREFLSGTIFADLTSDRNSALWTELDGQMLSDSDRASVVTPVHTLTPADHMNEITIPSTRDRPECSWLSIDGSYFDGSVDTPRISYAPGYVFSPRGGDDESISGLVLESTQAALNETAGRLYSVRNNPYKDVSLKSIGVYPYDICPQASLRYSGMNSGTFREQSFLEADFLIRSVSDEFQEKSLGLISSLKLEAIIRDQNALVGPNVPKAVGGVEGLFPPDISGIDPDDYNLNWPDVAFDWPSFDLTVPSGTESQAISIDESPAVYVATSTYIARTRNHTAGSPNWEIVLSKNDLGAVSGCIGHIEDFILDPWNPKMSGYVLCHADDLHRALLYYIENLDGAVGTQIITLLDNVVHTHGTVMDMVGMLRASINVEGEVWYLYDVADWTSRLYLRRRTSYTAAFATVFDADTGYGFGGATALQFAQGYHATGGNSGRCFIQYKDSSDANRWAMSTDQGDSFPTTINNLGLPAGLHVPYPDNPNDNICYAGGWGLDDPSALQRRNENGSLSYIAALVGGRYYCPYYWSKNTSIHSYTQDRQKIAYFGYNATSGLIKLFRSVNAGDTWTEITQPSGTPSYNLWGWPFSEQIMFTCTIGAGKGIWLSRDFFSGSPSWQDIAGDFEAVVGPIDTSLLQLVPVWVP